MRSAYSGKFTDLNEGVNRLTPGKMLHGLLRQSQLWSTSHAEQSRAGWDAERQLIEVASKGLQGPLEEQLKVIIPL